MCIFTLLYLKYNVLLFCCSMVFLLLSVATSVASSGFASAPTLVIASMLDMEYLL